MFDKDRAKIRRQMREFFPAGSEIEVDKCGTETPVRCIGNLFNRSNLRIAGAALFQNAIARTVPVTIRQIQAIMPAAGVPPHFPYRMAPESTGTCWFDIRDNFARRDLPASVAGEGIHGVRIFGPRGLLFFHSRQHEPSKKRRVPAATISAVLIC
jgi:hypothetical protein